MTSIPSSSNVLNALFRADLTTQWRNRRSVVLSLLVPVIILVAAKSAVNEQSAPYIMSMAMTIGIAASCLMGYTNSIARDRDKGIFQRLRVAPMPTWAIMASRLGVQILMILVSTIGVFLIGFYVDHIQLSTPGYAMGLLASLVAAAVFLGLGQFIVALVRNPDTVMSTTRLVYLALIVLSFIGASIKNEEWQTLIKWLPYGTVQNIMTASLHNSGWGHESVNALLATIAYAVVFTVIGIRKFSWASR